jgi:hypothetical protein
MDRYIWYSTPGQQIHPAVEELLSYKAEGLFPYQEKVILKSRRVGISSRIQIQQRRLDFLKACRQTGTVRAMALLRQELDRIDNLEEMRRAEILSPRPLPSTLVIDEVGPPHSSAPGPTPRFGQLSCLRRQRSR